MGTNNECRRFPLIRCHSHFLFINTLIFVFHIFQSPLRNLLGRILDNLSKIFSMYLHKESSIRLLSATLFIYISLLSSTTAFLFPPSFVVKHFQNSKVQKYMKTIRQNELYFWVSLKSFLIK